jgi:hypothetical protein
MHGILLFWQWWMQNQANVLGPNCGRGVARIKAGGVVKNSKFARQQPCTILRMRACS